MGGTICLDTLGLQLPLLERRKSWKWKRRKKAYVALQAEPRSVSSSTMDDDDHPELPGQLFADGAADLGLLLL